MIRVVIRHVRKWLGTPHPMAKSKHRTAQNRAGASSASTATPRRITRVKEGAGRVPPLNRHFKPAVDALATGELTILSNISEDLLMKRQKRFGWNQGARLFAMAPGVSKRPPGNL
jgi:hypothetical protein